MLWKKQLHLVLHITFFLILILVVGGGYFVEWVLDYKPCALCYLQRIGMMVAALSLLINLSEDNRRSLGLCLLSALVGSAVAIRHNLLKFCCAEQIQPIIFGRSLPFWSLIVFISSMVGVAVLLILQDSSNFYRSKGLVYRWLFFILLITTLVGSFSVLLNRGVGF
ncbi:MAG: disulfide bond formation protein B [Chlamydiae bacterium]|nr:disulfide bond formation protein B [Chlamydiota bacterium]